MPFVSDHLLAGVGIPQPSGMIFASSKDVSSVWTEVYRSYDAITSGKVANMSARTDFPKLSGSTTGAFTNTCPLGLIAILVPEAPYT